MFPVLGALILQAAYGAVDLLVVGRFGSTSGLSAVSTGSQVLNLVTFVVIQLAMGITVLIARYLGEKRPEQIGSVIGGSAIVFTIISVILFVIMVGFARPISVLMQAPSEAVDLTTSYVRICGGGILFIVAYNLLAAIFRGLGDSKSPLLFVLVACIVNIFGDLLLVAGLHMDAAGAAIATVMAQALSVVFAVILLMKKKLPFTIPLYLDGARLGYGLMSDNTDVTLGIISSCCDVFYIGGTKVGALCGEAVVFTKDNTPKHFLTHIKQHGALLAKGRLLGIQFDTLFTDDLYFLLGRHAIDMSELMKNGLKERGVPFYIDSPTNQQFLLLTNEQAERLKRQVLFSTWERPDEMHTVIRLATSWATTEENVQKLLQVFDEIM